MTLKILGIDPGRSGGAVLLEDARTVLRVHKFVEEDDFVSFIEEMKDMEVDAAYIEQVGAMPNQGVASSFKFGNNFGFERGVVRGAGIPMYRVRPQEWQKGLGLPRTASKTAHKNALKNLCSELFPSEKWTLATCDAALIARYGTLSLSSPTN